MSEIKRIIIVSDGTGGTAKRLMDAVLVQYDKSDVDFILEQTYQQVRTIKDVDRVLSEIDDEHLVLFTMISEKHSDYLHEHLTNRGILHLHILQPMVKTVSKFLGVHPNYRPGILQIIDDRYYRKVDAIGFTVGHDDGRGSQIDQADAVLLGLSRSCKTPISVYLACNYGLRVANIPVVRDAVITEALLLRLELVKPENIVGLLMDPMQLAQLRQERSLFLDRSGKGSLQDYYDKHAVAKEFRFCRDLFASRGWQTVDVSHRAIEEVSKEILRLLGHSTANAAL